MPHGVALERPHFDIRASSLAGASGGALTRDRHAGFAGFTADEHDNIGGANANGIKVVPARYLVPVPPAFEVEVKHFSTMKEILQDRMASLGPGGTREFPEMRGHIAGYTGYQPRAPPVDVGPQKWISLVDLNEQINAPPPEAPPPEAQPY